MSMDPAGYFLELSKELRAVQNRIRHLIGDANGKTHWPTDGAWKESVLRTILRRYLPPSFTVGTGFIVTAEGVSNQIDILVCDDSAPILFRDGDFLIATADCVRAAVEVKTQLSPLKLRKALGKVNDVSMLIRRRSVPRQPFLGLFCYEPHTSRPKTVLKALHSANSHTCNYEIQALCFGDRQFYRYWEFEPQKTSGRPYNSWHAYKLPEVAAGYFVHYLVEFLFPMAVHRAEKLWYPVDGIEPYCVAVMPRIAGPPT